MTVSVVVSSRATYARIQTVLEGLIARNVEVEVIATASAVEDRYGAVADEIELRHGVSVIRLESQVESDSKRGSVFVAARTAEQLAEYWSLRLPSVVLVNGDRYETLGITLSARLLDLPLAHIMGGEVSGNVDNYIRDANSCLSNIHFPATESAASRLKAMLQDASRVFRTGCPSVDLAVRARNTDISSWSLDGVGDSVDLAQPFAIVMLHAVTGEEALARAQAHMLAAHVTALPLQFLWFWPNSDPGSQQITQFIRSLRENSDLPTVRFIKNLPPSDFLSLLAKCALIIGNSSAAIREGAFLGVPAVNIGARQHARERGQNVVDTDWSASGLSLALAEAHEMGQVPSSNLYGSGDAGEQIARHLHHEVGEAP